MADFRTALRHTLAEEGGYVNDPQDPGGETYKGISRRNHPDWEGWKILDKHSKKDISRLNGLSELNKSVEFFYRIYFWGPILGNEITNQDVAECIFDFAVNAGVRTSVRLAQMSIGVVADGVMGPSTYTKLNKMNATEFLSIFSLAKISRYVAICDRNPTSKKFFFGWIKRTLKGL